MERDLPLYKRLCGQKVKKNIYISLVNGNVRPSGNISEQTDTILLRKPQDELRNTPENLRQSHALAHLFMQKFVTRAQFKSQPL